jgi:Tol biopolymer transport system component
MKTKGTTLAVLALLALAACAGQEAAATATPEYGSGSAELEEQPTQAASPTPEIVATLSAEEAIDLADLGQIAFTASDEGRRDVWLINPDGSDEFNLTRPLENVLAEAPEWSPDGKLIAFDGLIGVSETRDILLVTVDREDPVQTVITDLPGYDCYPVFSPDGETLLYMSERDNNRDLYLMDLDGNDIARITDDPTYDYEPAWSPDGTQIAFVSRRSSRSQIHVMDADGSNVVQLTDEFTLDWRPSWSPDGQWIAFESWRNGNADIFIMRPDGSDLRQLTDSLAEDGHPDWSPDGRYIVFHSKRIGDYQLFIMEVEQPENVWHLVTKSPRALLPVWSPPTAEGQ